MQRSSALAAEAEEPSAADDDDVATARSADEPPPMFPSSSKYHPDRNGLVDRRRWLVVDFDGTCTEHDTTPLLPRLAAFATRRRRSSCAAAEAVVVDADEANDVHRRDLENRLLEFQRLEEVYFALLQETKDGQAGDEGTLHDALDALDAPSERVTRMVGDSGVLRDLGRVGADELEDVLRLDAANDADEDGDDDEPFERVAIRLQSGCERTLARVLSNDRRAESAASNSSCRGWSLAVLSINWCPALIDASLVRPVLRRKRASLGEENSHSCDAEVPIWSNRVDDEGAVSLHVPGASAKRDRIAELRRRLRDDGRSHDGVIVYVGDSTTDLAALLEADVGIVVGGSGSTAAMAERWGIKITPLRHRGQDGFRVGGKKEEEEKRLWRAENWREIDDVLRELDEHWT